MISIFERLLTIILLFVHYTTFDSSNGWLCILLPSWVISITVYYLWIIGCRIDTLENDGFTLFVLLWVFKSGIFRVQPAVLGLVSKIDGWHQSFLFCFWCVQLGVISCTTINIELIIVLLLSEYEWSFSTLRLLFVHLDISLASCFSAC